MILATTFKILEIGELPDFALADVALQGALYYLQGYFWETLCLVSVIGWGWRWAARQKKPSGVRDLPGPWGLPIVGRVHDIDMKRSWFKFKEWADLYGPIYKTTMMGATHVWISDGQIAAELLSRRADIYSDRPGIPHMPGTKDGVEYLPFLRYGDVWRRQRRFGHSMLKRAYDRSYYGHLLPETYRFLATLLEDSTDYPALIDNYLGRITCLLGWGIVDPVRAVASNAYTFMYSLSPAGPLANAIPALMWLPSWLVRSKKMEQRRRTEEEALFTKLLRQSIDETMADERPPSYTHTLLEKKPGFVEREAAYAVGMMANVAILTTGSPLRTFMLAMVLHQDWQAMLRAEIDAVVGQEDRLVDLQDAPKLPILRAIIKECFRWRPVIPTGIPHELEQDDIWNGYFIPKGAYIHAVEWSLARNPNTYPDPDAFNPGRFLDPRFPTYREPLSKYPTVRGYHGFGFGRRICPGQEVAEAELLVACAALVWAFKLERKYDAAGREVPINDYNFTSTLITSAHPFEMDFVVRSQHRAQHIIERVDEMEQAS